MGKNTFFEPNHELGATFQSVSYFNYKGLKYKGKSGYKKYPIYLFISSDSLNFMFHIGEVNNNNGEHQHNYLFEISLGNIDEGLADVYRGDIVFANDTLLNRVIEQVYLRRIFDVGKGITFSDLELFDMEYPEDFIKRKGSELLSKIDSNDYKRIVDILDIKKQKINLEKKQEIENEANKINWEEYSYPLFRKIFLDFMFEFEINNTFKDLPHYNQIRKELHGNATYKALYTKLKFFYLRKLVDDNANSGIILRKLEELVDIESDWINIIRNPVSEHLFHHSKWFNDVEQEAVNTYGKKNTNIKNIINTVKKKETAGNQKTEDSRLKKYLHKLKKKKTEQGLDKDIFSDLLNKHRESASLLFDRLLQKYNISSVIDMQLSLSSKQSANIKLASILTIMVIIILHICSPVYTDKCLFGAGSVTLLLLIIIITRKRIEGNPLNLNILYPRFFIAICSAWILIGLNADIFKSFAFMEFSTFYCCMGILITMIMVFSLYRNVRKLNPFLAIKYCFMRAITILSIGFFYTFLVGIIMFSFVGKNFILSSKEPINTFYKDKLASSGFNIDDNNRINLQDMIKLEMINKDTVINNIRIKKDSMYMTTDDQWKGLGQIYKKSYLSTKYPLRAELYPCLGDNFSFNYLPVLFYMLVFIVLFIGVFIELLANDRDVTEPL